MIDKLNEILKGIDQDCCNGKDGWWETSCGAEFGAKKLKEVQDLVKKLTLTDVSQQRELFKGFLEKVVEETYSGDLTWQTREEAKDLLKLFYSTYLIYGEDILS